MNTNLKHITPEQKAIIDRPIPAEAVTQHPTKMFLSSIKSMYVTERLNEVFGIGSWRTSTEVVERFEKMVVVKLTFTVPEYGISYECYGGNDNSDLGDAYKGATTDALSKVASWLGIGAEVFKGKQKGLSQPAQQQAPAPAAPSKTKKRVTEAMLDDPVKSDCLLGWAYKFWVKDNYSETFDAGDRLLKSYDADDAVVLRFREMFKTYKVARRGR